MPMGRFLPNHSLDLVPHLPAASLLQNAEENTTATSQSGVNFSSSSGGVRAQLL